jgi:hypothetical protein
MGNRNTPSKPKENDNVDLENGYNIVKQNESVECNNNGNLKENKIIKSLADMGCEEENDSSQAITDTIRL